MKNRKISILTKEDILNAKNEFDVARNSFKQANLTEQELDTMMGKYKQLKKKIEAMSDKEKAIYHKESMKEITDSILAPIEKEKRRVRAIERKQKTKQRVMSFLGFIIFIIYLIVASIIFFKYFYAWYQKIDVVFSLVFMFLILGIPLFVEFLIRKYKIKIIKNKV